MTAATQRPGPLVGVRLVEFAAIGPAPFAAMLAADLGAEVLRIDRPGDIPTLPVDVPSRGRASLVLDLKNSADREQCLDILAAADMLIEGNRPGVMERLGLGPADVHRRNPGLIYGRMTGWGQEGPRAMSAGHDINYIALTGALHAMGEPGRPPVPPLNLVGDFGGGALYLLLGLLAALHRRHVTGNGDVVDASIVDGAASMMALYCGMVSGDPGAIDRGSLSLAGASPNYRCYECSDGRFVAVGALEPQFHTQLLALIGNPYSLEDHRDKSRWPELCERSAKIFATRTRDEWAGLAGDSDCCLTPVLTLAEAKSDPHMRARGVYLDAYGIVQPFAAPRFAYSPAAIAGPLTVKGDRGEAMAASWLTARP